MSWLNVIHVNIKKNVNDKDQPMTSTLGLGQAKDTFGGLNKPCLHEMSNLAHMEAKAETL